MTAAASTRDRLAEYRDTMGLSTTELGRELGVHGSTVSKYLNGKYEVEAATLAAFERTVEDVIKAGLRRREMARVNLFETSVSREVSSILDLVRDTGDVGLITGDAGIGKTCACQLYLRNNPSVIGLSMASWAGSRKACERAMFQSVETRDWKSTTSRGDYLIDRFRGSKRLVVIDMAHRLHAGGREWVFDFHDATGVSFALVGNAGILDAIRKEEQQFSRVGIRHEVKLTRGEPERIARAMLKEMAPSAEDEIADLATTIVAERGHGRSLRKHLALAQEMLSAAGGNWRKAVLMAHNKLITNYTLA